MDFCLNCLFVSFFALATDGVVATKRPCSANETMHRIENIVKQNRMIVFLRVDHAVGAGNAQSIGRKSEG
jgi:uncharacterized protein (DUF302 family)